MSLSDKVINALLSMDAYNRGYDQSIEIDGSSLGNAQITEQSNTQSTSQERQAGFYALAYDYNGETIIAYRGTDFPEEDTLRDIVNGWTLGAGNLDSQQGQMAGAWRLELQTYGFGDRRSTN